MSATKTDINLRYGQIIRIHGNQSDRNKGLMVVKGFTDLDARYMTFSRFTQIKNYREGLFQILPKGIFQIHEELNKYMKQQDHHNKDETQLYSLLNRAKTQLDQYYLLIQSKMGEFIYFGDDIILHHVNSNAFLSGSVQCSDGGLGSFKVELSQTLSSMLVFKLLPFRSYQKQGDKITLQCPLRIKNMQNRCYLSIEMDQKNQQQKKNQQKQQKKNPLQEKKRFQKFVKKLPDQCVRYNVVTTYSQSQTWMIYLHQSHQTIKDKKRINTHDIIYIVHTHHRGFLTSQQDKLILKEPLTQDPMLFSALWEIQFLPKGMQPEIGISQSSEQNFCLRQLLSGKTLGIYFQNKVTIPKLFNQTKPITIKSVKGGDLQDIKNGSLVKLALAMQDVLVELDADLYLPEPPPAGRFFFSKDLQYRLRSITVGDPANEIDHGFRMIKIEEQSQRDVLFALSSHQILFQFAQLVNQKQLQSLARESYLQNINKTILQLIAFIQNSSVKEIEDDRHKPIKKRQIIFKDLLILDIFFQILELMGKRIREEVYKQTKNQHQMFKSIFRNGYVLVYKIIKGNLTTKLYVSEWIGIIITQAIQIDENMIHITLNQILSNNMVVVSKYLSKSIIQKLLDIFINQPPHEKYLRILRSSCICDSQPILNNQNNILFQYFMKIEKIPEIMFKFEQVEGTIKIYSSISKKSAKLRTLKEFYISSNETDVKQTWQFFMSCLNLMADICFGRNQKAKTFVQCYIKLNQLCKILQNQQVKQIGIDSKDLLRAILRIINYAFVDTVGQDSITRTSRIRHYDTIQQRHDISTISITQPDLFRVLNFLVKELNMFESFESTDKKQLQFFLTILELLRTTLIVGYWESLESLSGMVPCLLKIMMNEKSKILKSYHDSQGQKLSKQEHQLRAFAKYKENVLKPIPQNELIIKCKLLATELLQIIFDFQIDVRVSQITMIFKQINQQSRHERGARHEKTALENVGVWRAKLSELFSTSSVLSKVQSKVVNYNLVFMELSQHQNPQLLAKSLNILKRIIQKRTQTISNFLNISLYSVGLAERKANHALSRRKKFAILNDENMLTVTQQNQNSFHYKVWDKASGVIQDLYFFCQNLKQKPSGMEIQLKNLFPRNEIYCIYNQRESVHTLSQNIIKCTQIHRELLNYIALCKKEKIKYMGELALKLLHSVYMFLSLLVKNNLQNKKEIMMYRHYYLEHAEYNCGAIQLLRDIYFNNKNLLHAEPQIEHVTSYIVKLIKDETQITYYKSKLLDFFRCFVFYNQKAIHYNATLILSKLQDPLPSQIHYKFTVKQIQLQVDLFQANYQQALTTHQTQVSMSQKLVYFGTIFNLFSNLIEDMNLVNIGKCMQVHDYSALIETVRITRNCWPLKRSLRAYINRLYYFSDNYQNLIQNILKQEVPIFIEDLDKVIEIKLLYQKKFLTLEILNPVRFKYLETYLYLYFQQVLISINETFNNQYFIRKLQLNLNDHYSRGRYFMHYYVIRIFERLACLKNLYRSNRFTRSFISSLLQNIKEIFLNRFAKVYSRIFDKNEQGKNHEDPSLTGLSPKEAFTMPYENMEKKKKNTEKLQLRSEMLISRLQFGQISTYYTDKTRYVDATKKNYPLTFLLPEREEQLVKENVQPSSKLKESSFQLVEKIKNLFNKDNSCSMDRSEELNMNLKRVEEVMMTTQFNQLLEEEFKERSQELFRNDQVSKQFYQFESPYISLRQWIQTIVITNSLYPNSLSTELKIFFFKLMRQFVESHNRQQQALEPIDTWDSSYWEQYSQGIVSAQNFLNDCGVAQYLCQCMKQNLEEKIELANEILLFGIAFLLGGNTECQISILKRLKQDKKNQVCAKLCSLIQHIGRINYNHYKLRKNSKQDVSKFSVVLVDNFDFYDIQRGSAIRKNVYQHQSNRELKYKQLCAIVFRRIFRFIQLLCENNNVEAKNFIRCQIDTDGTKMINTINFIEITTFEVRKLFKIMNKQIVELPMYLLDFINEVCQIPCQENQVTLCSTTFFEDVCYMASFLSNKENLSERNFKVLGKEDLIDLYNIYLKIIQIILSVFEGNIREIDLQLAAKVEFKFLNEIVTFLLQSMNIYSEQDIKKYFCQVKAERFLHKNIAEVIQIMVILIKLEQKEPNSRLIQSYHQFLSTHATQASLMRIVSQHICGIQLVINESKQKVYFPLHPVFQYLSGSTRDKIMAQVKRQTQREKLVGILSRKNQVFLEIEHNHFLSQNKFMSLPLSSSNVQKLYSISTLLSIIINLLFLLRHEVEIRYHAVDYIPDNQFMSFSLQLLSYLQLFVTILYFIGWWRMRQKMTKFLEAQHQSKLLQKTKKDSKISSEDELSGVWRVLHLLSRPFSPLFSALFRFAKKVYLLEQIGEGVKSLIDSVVMMAKWEDEFMSAMIFVVISILGTFYRQYFFMIHQFSIFSRINVLQNVFKAIAFNALQLIIVSSLGIVFVYVFSLIGFETYVEAIYEQNSNYCTTVIECILSLYISGVIGGGMSEFKIIRFTYDIVYFIFFGLLFGNIVSGIMIDTFAELRDWRNEVERDKKNYCFICGIDKATLEKQNNTFDNHTRKEHFLWNYIFFLYELEMKNKMNYTGIEYYISQLSIEVINWIPAFNQEGKSHLDIFGHLSDRLLIIGEQTKGKLKKIQNDVDLLKGKLSKES